MLARGTRALFLNARAAVEAAPEVGRLLAGELGRSAEWEKGAAEEFPEVARGYVYER